MALEVIAHPDHARAERRRTDVSAPESDRRPSRLWGWLTLLGLVGLAVVLRAGGPLVGTVEGRVVVDLGLGETAPLPEVTVTLIHKDQNRRREYLTGSEGQYVFQNLPLGNYVVRPHKDGYRVKGPQTVEFTVNVDQTHVVLPPFHLVPIG